MELRAAGRMRLVTPKAEIEVTSGDAGALAASRQEQAAREALQALLARVGAARVEEAEERARVGDAHAAAVRAAENNLTEELGGQTEEDLGARVAALGPARPARPLAECSAELARLQAESEALRRELKTVSAQLSGWAERFGRMETVVDRLADSRLRDQEIPASLPHARRFLMGSRTPDRF